MVQDTQPSVASASTAKNGSGQEENGATASAPAGSGTGTSVDIERDGNSSATNPRHVEGDDLVIQQEQSNSMSSNFVADEIRNCQHQITVASIALEQLRKVNEFNCVSTQNILPFSHFTIAHY